MRYAGTAPDLIVKLQKVRRGAARFDLGALCRIEQIRHFEPGHRTQRRARTQRRIEAVVADQIGQQHGAGAFPFGDCLAERAGLIRARP